MRSSSGSVICTAAATPGIVPRPWSPPTGAVAHPPAASTVDHQGVWAYDLAAVGLVTHKEQDMARNRSRWSAILLDVGERAGWSAGQVFFATLVAGGTAVAVGNLPWKLAGVLAGSAAVASIVLTAIQYAVKQTNLK